MCYGAENTTNVTGVNSSFEINFPGQKSRRLPDSSERDLLEAVASALPHEVTLAHRRALAAHCGKTGGSFQDEAQCGRSVPVRWRQLGSTRDSS